MSFIANTVTEDLKINNQPLSADVLINYVTSAGTAGTSEKVDGRTIHVFSTAPTSADGVDGDIWFQYTP